MNSLLEFSSIPFAFASIVLSQGHHTTAEWPSPHHQFSCCQMTTVYLLLFHFTVCSVTSWLTKLPWSHPHNNMGFLVLFIQHWAEKNTYPKYIYIYIYINETQVGSLRCSHKWWKSKFKNIEQRRMILESVFIRYI